MKIAHLADIHWGLNYPGPAPDSRFNDITRTMDWAAGQIMAEGCDLVLVAGDCFKDNRVFLERASIEIRALVNWLRLLSAAGIPVVIISGTPFHDPVAAYELIKEIGIPGVEIFTRPGVKHLDGVSIACLPGMNRSDLVTQEEYHSQPPHIIHHMMTEKITQTCRELRDQCDGQAILMAHLSYDMADKGFEDVLMQHEPVLTVEATANFNLVCLGHIHRPQRNGNVFYCGSPERLSFNDEGIDAGFWIHEINLDLPYDNIDSLFIETPARCYYTAQWDERDIDRYLEGNKLSGVAFNDVIVRLHYTCDEATAKRLDRKALERALYGAGAFFVAEIKADVQRQERARDNEVTESLGPVEALARWGEGQGIPVEEIAVLQSMTAELMEVV
jgi:exonuclease SbcC/exonuclease SbcD